MPKPRPPGWPPNWPYWSRPKGSGGRRLSVGVPVIPPFPPVPPPDPPVDPLSIYSEFFDGPSLNPLWQPYLPDLITLNTIVGGQWRYGAFVGGLAGSHWFNLRRGILYGPLITGDAIMLVTLRARNYAGDAQPPASDYRLVGGAVHDPDDMEGNYTHEAIGRLVPEDGPGGRIEMKNNVNGVSDYFTLPWDLDVVTELAFQFIDQICTLAARTSPSDPFTVTRIIDRNVEGPPMPLVKWWGAHAYSDQAVTDTSATIDSVIFQTPGFNGGLILPTS